MITHRYLFYSLLVNIFHAQFAANAYILPADHHPHQTLESCKIDKIYQLGDSLSDTGNLILEFPTGVSSSAARLPYGQDFHNHPTGRFSNGLLIIDYIASAVGLPFLNPYKKVGANFTHGVNFAVGGCTALSSNTLEARNIKPSPTTNSSLDVQLRWMSDHFQSICLNYRDCAEKLRHALFFIGEIGGNDYNYALWNGMSSEEIKPVVKEVVLAIKNAAREVIHHGGVRLVIPGHFPSGCFPCQLTEIGSDDEFGYDNNHCLKERNSLSEYHNHLIQQAIKELKQDFPNVTIIYADYYNAFLWLFQNAHKLGFDEESKQKACCGAGGKYNYDPRNRCGHPETTVCDYPNVRISWDGVHLTQAAYMNIAEWLITAIIPQLQCSGFDSTGLSIS